MTKNESTAFQLTVVSMVYSVSAIVNIIILGYIGIQYLCRGHI